VVDGEDVRAPEAERLVMGVVRAVRLCAATAAGRSCGWSPDRYFAREANLKFWVFVSCAPP
jgi:hypothetical protein